MGFLSCGLEEVSGFASGQEMNIYGSVRTGSPKLFVATWQTYSFISFGKEWDKNEEGGRLY
jgi:hypothetical protein